MPCSLVLPILVPGQVNGKIVSSFADTTPRRAAPALGTFERYLTVWVALCIVAGIALGRLVPGPFQALGRADGRRGQHPGRRADLADDRADAAQGRFRRAAPRRRAMARHRGDGRHQLAGQAVQHGAARLAVHRLAVPAVAARRPDRQLHRRAHPAGRGALHGDGVRVVEPDRWRAELHAEPGRAERHDHGVRVRADRRVAARPVVDHGAVGDAVSLGRALHRRAGDRRATVAPRAAREGRRGGAGGDAAPAPAGVARRAAGDARAAVRVSGRGDRAPAAW